jgi:LPPG:FO 2-phospho-L-lactate transferase
VRIVIMAGGVGGSRFARGVRRAFPHAELTIIANTADDITVHGLRVCPDLDTIMYALGDGHDPVRGWGRRDESWAVLSELAAYGAEPSWFSLGDRDLATHLVRTEMLAAGHRLSEVTAALATRWLSSDPLLSLLPMSDDRVETHILIADQTAADGRKEVHFQEYWVRWHAEPEALGVIMVGLAAATPAPGVIDRLANADLILIAPSNPVVSIGPILGVPGIAEAVRQSSAAVIGFAGILGGAPVLGMAHRLLPAIGVAVDAASIGLHYGPRAAGGVLDVWTMDLRDASTAAAVEQAGLRVAVADLIMSDPEATAAFVHYAIKTAWS